MCLLEGGQGAITFKAALLPCMIHIDIPEQALGWFQNSPSFGIAIEGEYSCIIFFCLQYLVPTCLSTSVPSTSTFIRRAVCGWSSTSMESFRPSTLS